MLMYLGHFCFFPIDGSLVADATDKEVTDVQEKEVPPSVTFPIIKAQHEVSFVSVCTSRCLLSAVGVLCATENVVN